MFLSFFKWLMWLVSGCGSLLFGWSNGLGGSFVYFWGLDGEVKCDFGDDWSWWSVSEGSGLLLLLFVLVLYLFNGVFLWLFKK